MESLLNWTNALLCVGGAYACLCRLGNMEEAKTALVLHYSMWFVLLLASATSPIQFGPVTEIQFILGAGVVAQLALGFKAWKNGAPSYTRQPNIG